MLIFLWWTCSHNFDVLNSNFYIDEWLNDGVERDLIVKSLLIVMSLLSHGVVVIVVIKI